MRRLRMLRLSLLGLMILVSVGVTSCSGSLTKTEIFYSRSFRAQEETKGHLRLAQDPVMVNITGTNEVSELSATGAYFLVHEGDLVGFVRSARRLALSDRAGRLLSEEEVEAMPR